MDAYGVLVIILSITLAIFLVVAIIATVMFIRFMKKLKDVPERINNIASNVESVSEAVARTATPLMVFGKFIDKVWRKS